MVGLTPFGVTQVYELYVFVIRLLQFNELNQFVYLELNQFVYLYVAYC